LNKIKLNLSKIEIDFTDTRVTGRGGQIFLSQTAQRLGLGRNLEDLIHVNKRNRGGWDKDKLLSLIYSFGSGGGHLSDLDALRKDKTSQSLLGLPGGPGSRRMGEYLKKFTTSDIASLEEVGRKLTAKVAPSIISHEMETRGYVPLFMDGTGLEVSGRYFEGSAVGYDGENKYWLHGTFIGTLWVSGRLGPGNYVVPDCWEEQLDKDVVPLLGSMKDISVWMHADNAYYRKGFVSYCHRQQWDYSVSVTHAVYKAPILRDVENIPEKDWENIGMDEEATLVKHLPADWDREQNYVIIRQFWDGNQRRVIPIYTVILVSRTDLPLAELVKRHRQKQGQENAFKGPLTEMDLHHPPCHSFLANQAVYACGLLAQVLLKAVQYNLLPKEARKHGIRPIIRYLIQTAALLVRSGRQWTLKFSKDCFRLDWLAHIALQRQ